MTEKSKKGGDLNIVPFVSVDHMMKIVDSIGMESILEGISAYIEEAFSTLAVIRQNTQSRFSLSRRRYRTDANQ